MATRRVTPKQNKPTPWQRFGNWAQIASPIVATVTVIAAGWFAIDQIADNRQSAARQMFRSHLELEMKYPAFAEPDFGKIEKTGAVEMHSYGSFVNHLLYTCEELTIATKDDAGWRTACEMRVKAHSAYLCKEVDKEDLGTYDVRIQKMIKMTRCKAGCRVDDCSPWVKT